MLSQYEGSIRGYLAMLAVISLTGPLECKVGPSNQLPTFDVPFPNISDEKYIFQTFLNVVKELAFKLLRNLSIVQHHEYF